MSAFIDFLFDAAPWLRPVLAWSIAFLVVVLILTVPAYFILWPFFERASTRLAAFIGSLAERQKGTRLERANRLNSGADEFLKDSGLWRLKSEGEGQWAALAGGLVRVLKKLRKPVGKAAKSLDKLYERVSALQEDLRQSEVAKLQALPGLLEPEESAESAGALRVAWMTLILAGTVLLGLMLVNTGMLSQILRDLGVVPAAMTFAGIPLAYVFAFILTLVEAGLGVAHGATRSKNPDKLSIWPAIMTVFAVIVAGVEGFFYSRVAPSTGTFSLPFLNYEMPQIHLFFFWGFVLVMTLFSLGSIGFEACATILRGSKSGTLRREMNKLRKQYERYAAAVGQSEAALKKAKATATNADKLLQGPVANGESVRQELDRVSTVVEALKGVAPEWAKDKMVALTRTEVHQLAQTGGLWLSLALIGMVVMTITGLSSFEAFYRNLQPLMLWVLAIGQAVLFFGVGFLLGAGETVVEGGEGERRVWAAPRFSRWGAYVVGGSLVITYITLFFIVAWPMGLGGVWFLNLLIGLFLIAAGYELSPLLNAVRLCLWRLCNVVVFVLEASWMALIRVLQLVVVILENVAYLLATPLDKVFPRRLETAEVGPTLREPVQAQTSSSAPRIADAKSASGVGDHPHPVIDSVDPPRR